MSIHRRSRAIRVFAIVVISLACALTAAADSPFVAAATLAQSTKAHDLLKEPAGASVQLPSGEVYIADSMHHRIVSVRPNGSAVVAAGTGKPGLTDGAPTQAQFKQPRALVFDSTRSLLYIADTGNHVIRRIAADGSVSTLAGSGRPEFADGAGRAAGFKQPAGLAIDTAGNLYVADTGNSRIRRITPAGIVTTVAGGVQEGLANGPPAHALFAQPEGIAVSPTGAIFIADTKNNVLRKLEGGMVVTVAGTGHNGRIDGPGTLAEFDKPSAIAFDDAGALYVADTKNNAVRKVVLQGATVTVSTIDTLGISLKEPAGIDVRGALFIGDSKNDALRVLYPAVSASSLEPRTGPPSGGSEIRLFGSGFVPGATQVSFGANAAQSVTYIKSTELLIRVPASTGGGAVNVTVTTPAGTSTLANGFSYGDGPAVFSITPSKAPASGGIAVTISGGGFVAGGTTVTIGGIPAAVVNVVSASSLTAIAPGGAPGAADVVVTTSAGTATLTRGFTWLGLPVIGAFSPMQGLPGTTVIIDGSGFDPVPAGNQVSIGGVSAAVLSATATRIVATVPASARSGRVSVTTLGGTATSALDFLVPNYTRIAISPATAPLAIGESKSFTASGIRADGSSDDLTARVTWTCAPASIATINAGGQVTGVAAGNATITATFLTFSATATVTVTSGPPLPPDPSTTAPPADPTIAPPPGRSLQFLYTGPNAIQTGVAAGTITEQRVAVLRGIVRSLDGQPLRGVKVTHLGHPELGQTLSRADGAYDFGLNGGGTSTLVFEKSGYATAQRTVDTVWNEQRPVDDVVMVAYDTAVATIAMNAAAAQQARASVASDADGSRRATLIFPAGTGASLVMPNGSTTSVSTLHVRATEYTVGPNGPKAMPAALPAMSAYTYCVELSADEAVSAGAKEVRFTRPVSFYVENFLGMPVGTHVPSGYYDRTRAAWIGSENGRVIKVVSITAGRADLDVNGDGAADSGTALTDMGIDDAERSQVALLYAGGQTLWRVRVPHFTPWDYNFPYAPPSDAQPPNQPQPDVKPSPARGCGESGNSIVDCANQTLGEQVGIVGTPYSIEYNSARIARTQYATTVHVTGASIPASLNGVELEINVAGQRFTRSFAVQPNLDYNFVWDGRDAYGRAVQGSTPAMITIRYRYPLVYTKPAEFGTAWARAGNNIEPIGQPRANANVVLNQTSAVQLGHFETNNAGLGGWTFSPQRFYDGRGLSILDSGGSERRGDPMQMGARTIATSAGNGQCCYTWSPDGTPAAEAAISEPVALVAAADGTYYVTDAQVIGKIAPNGILTTIAGDKTRAGFTPDGVPAKGNPLNGWDLAVHPDGTLYFNDQWNRRIRKLVNGAWVTVAGGGSVGDDQSAVNGMLATELSIRPEGIDIGPDGSLYIADYRRVLRVAPDGIVSTIGGGKDQIDYEDNVPAVGSFIGPIDIAVAPDGSVYISDSNVIQRITPDGILHQLSRVWRDGALLKDGDLSTSGFFDMPWGIDVTADGTLIIADTSGSAVRSIAPNGIVSTIAGTGTSVKRDPDPNGSAARGAEIGYAWDAKLAPDGTVLVVDTNNLIVRRTGSMFPAWKDLGLILPSPDGKLAYQFDNGRHTKTLDTLTGVTLETLSYDSNGFVTSIADRDGNVTTIQRGANGVPTAIVAPGGQRTTLTLTGGRLTKIENPASEWVQFSYDAIGLLTQTIDPRGGVHKFTYDGDGLLIKDEGPDGGFISLTRSGIGREYSIDRRSAEGRAQTYRLTTPGQTSEQREHTAADGRSVNTLYAVDGYTSTMSDGSTAVTHEAPDARFGLLAPFTRAMTVTSGAHTVDIERTRAVTLADPLNPLSLTGITETWKQNGRTWTTSYAAATRTQLMVSPEGRRVTTVLDAKGRLGSMQAAGLGSFDITYNAKGQTASVRSGSRTMSFGYDAQQRLTSITDALSQTTQFSYDAADRITSQTMGGRVISFTYDAAGNMTSITPASRPAQAFSFNAVNRPLLGGGMRFTYNKDRQLTAVEQPGGTTLSLTYASTGHLAALSGGSVSLTFGYTGDGQLSTVERGGQNVSFGYDGRQVASVSWSGEITGSVGFAWDNELRVAAENGFAYGYDDDGLLISAGALALTRHPDNSLVTGTALGNFADAITHDANGMAVAYTAAVNGAEVFAQEFTYDDGRRITQKRERLYGIPVVFDYTYDDAGRLATVSRESALVASYTYDASGNRLTRTSGSITESGVYDDQDRLMSYAGTTYAYNAGGERSGATDAAGTTTSEYDELGNPRKVTLADGTVIEYVVDGMNRRVGKKVNGTLVRGWLYADDLRIVAELDGSGAVVSRFVYATKGNSPDYMVRNGTTWRIIHDHLGSPRLVLDAATGDIAQSIGYDEYGNVLTDSNPGFQPFGFAGGLYDPATSLVRFGARDYDPHTGRWTSRDPIGFAGGDTNLYAYAMNDPVNLIDPSGLLFGGTVNAGEAYGEAALGMYADILADPDAAWYEKAGAAVGGFFSALWTPCTSDSTFTVLSTAAGGAGGLRAAGSKAAGTEFSHWIPGRFLKNMPKFIREGFGLSRANGNYVSAAEHALNDPFRYRFMPAAWKTANPINPALVRQLNRLPKAVVGTGAGGAVGGAASAGGGGCGCP